MDDESNGQIRILTRRLKKVEQIEAARSDREQGKQRLGYSSRPFVLCGLPLRRPKGKNTLVHVRKNGHYFLRVTADPEIGLPFGQDRLIPIMLATLAVKQNSRTVKFRNASELLREFGLPSSGQAYNRLMDGFKRVFSSTIFFGTEQQLKSAAVWDWTRFHYVDRLRLWRTEGDDNQANLPGDEFENIIELSEPFWNELQEHKIPVEQEVVKALAHNPGALDLYLWLAWRSYTVRPGDVVQIPLFGAGGLANQLGSVEYTQERRFRGMLKEWLGIVRTFWPECSAGINDNGTHLVIRRALAIATSA